LFQLLTMTAMEPPISFDADEVRNKQAEVLHAIQPLDPEEVLTNMVRGQYGPGMIDGQRIVGYRSEPDVAPGSNTETFVALKLFRRRTQHRLRASPARLHGRRCHALSTRRHGRSRLERDSAHTRRVACSAPAWIPQLCGRFLGAHRSRRIAREGWSLMAPAG